MGFFPSDVAAQLDCLVSVAPQSASAGSVNGGGVDRVGFRSGVLFGAVGAASGTPTTQSVIFKVQDSDDNVTFSDYESYAASAITADDGEVELPVDLSGAKKYVRVVATVAFTGGTSPAIPIFGGLVLGGAVDKPANG